MNLKGVTLDLICPFCKQDSLLKIEDTQCCEECGGSFQVIQEPQDILLENVKSEEDFDTACTVRGISDEAFAKAESNFQDMMKERDEFFAGLKVSLPRGVLKPGTEVEIPYLGIGFEYFIQKNYRDLGYEDFHIIRCAMIDVPDLNDPNLLKGITSKTLVVMMEPDRAYRDTAQKLETRLKETDCTYILATNHTHHLGYERMKG